MIQARCSSLYFHIGLMNQPERELLCELFILQVWLNYKAIEKELFANYVIHSVFIDDSTDISENHSSCENMPKIVVDDFLDACLTSFWSNNYSNRYVICDRLHSKIHQIKSFSFFLYIECKSAEWK